MLRPTKVVPPGDAERPRPSAGCQSVDRAGQRARLGGWLETGFVCDRDGRRFVAARGDDWERYSNTGRVVEMRQLKQWYRTLDQLLARQSDIELARD